MKSPVRYLQRPTNPNISLEDDQLIQQLRDRSPACQPAQNPFTPILIKRNLPTVGSFGLSDQLCN